MSLEYLEFAFELADRGAAIALERFRDRQFETTIKPDGSPVTDVDQGVERVWREELARRHPSHAVLGEEYGASGKSDWCWYLDPIDGTSAFVENDPKWMMLIALAHRDEIVVGLVEVPASGQRWWATRGHGAFHNGEPIAVSSTARIADAVVNDDWDQTLRHGVTRHPLATIGSQCASVRPHQDHSFLGVASGDSDVAIELDGHTWDYAALKIIVEEAGGRFSDLAGLPRIDSLNAIVSNGLIHDQALDLLRSDG